MKYLFNRFKENSTWTGITLILTSIGCGLNPDQFAAIAPAGLAIAGLIGAFFPDKKEDAKK